MSRGSSGREYSIYEKGEEPETQQPDMKKIAHSRRQGLKPILSYYHNQQQFSNVV